MSRRILVTNDDGINAPGLKSVERIAETIGGEVWVVAPEVNHSGAGHSLTLKRPLRIREVSERRYAIDGTPTDCVLLALQTILKDQAIDLVLSGVNNGGNVADDVTYSGTIAAAMEATLMDVPAIALSQCCRYGHPVKWATAEHFAPDLIRRATDLGWSKGVLLNVNFPDRVVASVEGIAVTCQGKRKVGDQLVERIDPRGEPYIWIGTLKTEHDSVPETDVTAVEAGIISITPIHLDMTHIPELERFRRDLRL
ncbi:MAG: 5'/3'-nucleotidase SurE [Geminicoccaceae bacterium]